MKILYAVQATGNGHISRAMELMPHLTRFGAVDIFLSGNNSHLVLDAPVKYRSKGLSLYYNATGGLDYWKIIRGFHPLRLRKEINDLPVEKYDLVINDFEFITAAACAKKKVPSIQVGHQASFQSPFAPRPVNKNVIGEWILKNYARATHYIGLHFDRYDAFILPPVIKREVLESEPADKGHITVYLPSCSLSYQEKIFQSFRDLPIHVFSKEVSCEQRVGNFHFYPVNKFLFNKSLINCTGIITGAGFETPAEALYLRKKIMVLPARGQYEQQCNAAALARMGVMSLKKIDTSFYSLFTQWLNSKTPVPVNYGSTIPQLLNCLFTIHESRENHCRKIAARETAWFPDPVIAFSD
jgi:uncharacterized protein (TIGR00661 family)